MAKNATTTKKVGTKSSTEKESKKRTVFSHAKPLTEIPASFDWAKHRPLKQKDFANKGFYLRFRAAQFMHSAEVATANAEKATKAAIRFETVGDEKTAKKVKRAERIAKQLAELQAELAEQGIDLDTISAE